jgi:hypothetical protein
MANPVSRLLAIAQIPPKNWGLSTVVPLDRFLPSQYQSDAPNIFIRIEIIPLPPAKFLFNGPTVPCCHRPYERYG